MDTEQEYMEELLREMLADSEKTGNRFQRRAPSREGGDTLQAMLQLARPSFSSWCESFFTFMGHFSEAQENEPFPEAPEHLRTALLEYLPSTMEGPFDESRNRICMRIGMLAHLSGVNPFIFTSGITRLMGGTIEFLRSHLAPELADLDVLAYYNRMLLLDTAVILEALFRMDRTRRDRLAHMDPLTKLNNEKRLREALRRRLEPGATKPALALIGISQIAHVSDTLGASAGDRILQEAAARLFHLEAEGWFVARAGAEQFALLPPPSLLPADFPRRIRELILLLAMPVHLEGAEFRMNAVAGITSPAPNETDPGNVLRQCELALKRARDTSTPIVDYNISMERFSFDELVLLKDLGHAIGAGELVLHYHPQVSLDTGLVAGAEALVRWIHPTRGFMPPGRFIQLAEKTVLIHALTERVLRDAIAQARTWELGGMPLTISVNLSSVNLQNPGLPELIAALLGESGLNPGLLSVEITESAIHADPDEAAIALGRLRALGIRIAIDDFGLGYSSMAFLRNLPVNEVKIDRTFVFGMLKDPRDESIVDATIRLCRGLGLDVCAEGIEDEATYNRLRDAGCTYAQGFFLAKPMAVDDFVQWIQERAARTTS
jgi:diguanylate cyclase (GGDEF)-like protein